MWRLDESARRKYLAARALGLEPRLCREGWPGLTAKEAGRIGGYVKKQKNIQ